jgi:multidrug resistance protein
VVARNVNTNVFTVAAQQPILGLLHRERDLKAASASADASRADQADAQSQIAEQVRTTYLRLFEARAGVAIAEASIEQLQKQVQDAQARYNAGTITKADLLRFQTAVANAEQQRIQAATQAQTARQALLTLLARNPEDPSVEFVEPVELEREAAVRPGSSNDELINRALQNRPEVQRAQKEAEAARANGQARLFELLPEVDVQAAYSNVRGQIFQPENSSFIGVATSWPFFTWGTRWYAAQSAQRQADASASLLENTRKQVAYDVSSNAVQLEAQFVVVQVAETAIASAEEAYRVTSAQVSAGTATTTDLLDAQSALTTARLNLARAQYERTIARVALIAPPPSGDPMPAEAHPEVSWRPSHSPGLVGLTVTLATFMEVLDTSIANVALPHIAGGLSASQDEATWVLTSYLVSNAVVLPISAWISSRVGRKRFYMACVVLFTISSALCGFAPNHHSLIFFRVLQGIGGGGLAPSEQGILADTFEPRQRGMGFAMYGLAVVFAPAIGPTLGGYIVDHASWRWIFYINIPVGIVSLILSSIMVEDPPWLSRRRSVPRGAGGLAGARAGGGGLRQPADRPGQGAEGRLVQLASDRGLRHADGHLHGGDGGLGVGAPQSNRQRAALQEPQLRHQRCADVHPRGGALRDHGAHPPVRADADGIQRRARGHGPLTGRLHHHGDDAAGGLPGLPGAGEVPDHDGVRRALAVALAHDQHQPRHRPAHRDDVPGLPGGLAGVPLRADQHRGLPGRAAGAEQPGGGSDEPGAEHRWERGIRSSSPRSPVARRPSRLSWWTGCRPPILLQERLTQLQQTFASAGPAEALQRAYAALYLTIQQQAAVLSYVRIIEDLAIVTAVFVPLIILFLRKNRPGEAPAGAH